MTSGTPSNELTKPKLLIVEGDDDKDYFVCLAKHLKLNDDIEIVSLKGIDNLKSKLKAIIETAKGLDTLVSIGIICDADTNSQRAFGKITLALQDQRLPIPKEAMKKSDGKPSIQIMLLPDNHHEGALEDLCLNSLDESSQECIERYLTCMKKAKQYKSKNEAKSKIYAYIAAQGNPRMTLGCSAHENCWDFNHPAFSQIIQFLRSL